MAGSMRKHLVLRHHGRLSICLLVMLTGSCWIANADVARAQKSSAISADATSKVARINPRALVNHLDDPDLAEAMQYDSEQNGYDQQIASQSKAEAAYLRFLSKSNDQYLRVWAYSQLGVLFSTNLNPEKGEKRDYKKAGEYFAKAIEEAGDRIGRPVYRARLNRITPDIPPAERIKMRIEAFEWLSEFDRATAQDRWLVPQGYAPPTDSDVSNFLDRVERFTDALAWNMTGEAFLTDDPVHYLNLIKRRLPDTRAEEMADRRLAQREQAIDHRVQQHAESTVDHIAQIAPLDDEPPEPERAARIDTAAPSPSPTTEPSAEDNTQQEDSTPNVVVYGAIALAVLVVAGGLVHAVSRKRNPPSAA